MVHIIFDNDHITFLDQEHYNVNRSFFAANLSVTTVKCLATDTWKQWF